jgi:hypothetical protein
LGASGGQFQPFQFLREFETKLVCLFFRQPVRHLREYNAPDTRFLLGPGQGFGGFGLGEEGMQLLADLFRVGQVIGLFGVCIRSGASPNRLD